MGVNRGKQFEDIVRRDLSNVKSCSVDRLHDQTSGYVGSSNICDFIVYKKPTLLYLECKSCYGNTLNFHNITDTQWKGLLDKSKIFGVVAGVMVWFIDLDRTLFIPIQNLEQLRKQGNKSINGKTISDNWCIDVEGSKKKIFFTYDMKKFLEEVEHWYG